MTEPSRAPRPETLADAAAAARACRICAPYLPHGCRPTFRLGAGARVLVVGQAPGRLVHETGIPWNDPSGNRLRAWLGVDRATFYDESRIAILPAGLCYPGTDAHGADRPPRPECAPLWHPRLRPLLPEIRLVLAIGRHAQRIYLPEARGSVAEIVARFREHPPGVFALPHPSWRINAWIRRHPWFEEEVLPALRHAFAAALA